MIREQQILAQFERLERHVLVAWIDDGVVAPEQDAEGYLFEPADAARVALACDLHYRMGLDHASLPIILSLVDQLHDTRRHLRALARAVATQPHEVRTAIVRHITAVATDGEDAEPRSGQ